jgi:hypothetical protein
MRGSNITTWIQLFKEGSQGACCIDDEYNVRDILE